MPSKRIVVVHDYADLGTPYYRPFADFAPLGNPEMVFQEPNNVLCVVFTGGEDVDPAVYGEKKNHKTFSNIRRDREEETFFFAAKKAGIPMAGICRGAQFLCAMNGGKLAQHIWNHGTSHTIRTLTHGVVTVTSTHHQMAIPPKDATIIAWAEPRRSDQYEGASGEWLQPEFEVEGVLYPATQSLGMQWHPEIMRPGTPGWDYTQSLISKLLAHRRAGQ